MSCDDYTLSGAVVCVDGQYMNVEEATYACAEGDAGKYIYTSNV
jgi:hypothetical protein